jgi:hypothetical protein
LLRPYLNELLTITRQGDAREETYYSALKKLLEDFASLTNRKNVSVTVLPKKTEAGNPDFRLWDGRQRIIGYVEAKPLDKNLDEIEKTEQIRRYLTTFPNFILTNFVDFRFYRNGVLRETIRVSDPSVFFSFKGVPAIKNEEEFDALLEKFFSYSLPSITTAQALAVELAKRTRFLRDAVIAEELREEEASGTGQIIGFYEAFQKYLIRGLGKQQFADLYSQTITYGLFSSRMRAIGKFDRRLAVYYIPPTIGILKEMFQFISLGQLPTQLEWIVDEISNVLSNVNVNRIFSDYYASKRGEDPVFHFYETFLAEYDPEEREKRGVYYTPLPVVSYIVRSLHILLKEKFNLADGLADKNVTLLDPAAGTLTFLAEAIRQASKEFTSKYGEGGKNELIREHILRDFYAFELMIAPYVIGHLKISFLLEGLGYSLQDNERAKFYLTNTLELEDIQQTSLPGMGYLAEESRKAGEVKKQIPILIVLGNPPYSGSSVNKGEWIVGLIEDYKTVDGKPLGEKNPKWLQDDYVKFIRFAEWKIRQNGEGIVGYISNHSYLDNPTFRGMRQHLMKSFNEIYVLDLHGNSKKKERCPDGSKDENVFDIQQGVVIAFFIKIRNISDYSCKVYHGDVWGLRDKKYEWLLHNDYKTTKWQELNPHSSFYFFVPRNEKYEQEYNKFWGISKIFPVCSVGIATARDGLTIKWTDKDVRKTVINFLKMDNEQARKIYNLGKDVRDWKVALAKQDLERSGLTQLDNEMKLNDIFNKKIVRILYRPFDVRYTYYTGTSRGFHCMPRPEVMKHLMQDNLAMCVGRAGNVVGSEKPWNLAYCSKYIIDLNLFYRGGSANFPLYLYRDQVRHPNINNDFYDALFSGYHSKPLPEDAFGYIYAILYSNTYRNKYNEFLKTDYPKIPFTSNLQLFGKMAKLGISLIGLHMMKADELGDSVAKFQGIGDNLVEQITYDEKEKKVQINKNQFFEGVDKQVWEYHIGGYQVLEKWLKDRKTKKLSLEEIMIYCKIVTAIKKTIDTQAEIDKLYPEVEKEVIEFKESQNAALSKYA